MRSTQCTRFHNFVTPTHTPIITILPHTHIGVNEIQIISKFDLKLIRRHVIVLNMLARLFRTTFVS